MGDFVVLPPICPQCDGPLTCDADLRHRVAQLLDRAEAAEATLTAQAEEIEEYRIMFGRKVREVKKGGG